jgi:hypothetical protein
MTTKRTFTIQASEIGFTGGVYKSDLPSKASKKAAKRLFELIQDKTSPYHAKHANLTKVKFILREKSQGSAKKTFFYEAEKKDLASPKIVKVKAPTNPKADADGFITYEVTKKIQVKAYAETHHNFQDLAQDL